MVVHNWNLSVPFRCDSLPKKSRIVAFRAWSRLHREKIPSKVADSGQLSNRPIRKHASVRRELNIRRRHPRWTSIYPESAPILCVSHRMDHTFH